MTPYQSKLTQQARHVANSETIRLPTLKELIGYPTTYYDDRTATTTSSILLHLLRNEVDNDINQQNVDELLKGIDESQNGEKEFVQSSRDTIEEIDDWLEQASENKARSRAPRKENVTNFDEQVSVTNTIPGDENKRKTSTTSVYLKPTTMRGIPLVSLISNPIMRGFYITKNEADVPSSILADSTPSYTTTDTPVEQQTETILIPDISTTVETVTVVHNDQIESGPNTPDDNVNDIINNKGVDTREEKYSTLGSSVIFSNTENFSNHKKSDLITIPVDRPVSKRRRPLRTFDHTTPLSNSYVVSSTTPTRRRIALAVSKYNEATTPLWSGRRIVAKKRIRTTVSPIKDAIRRTESDFIHAATSTLSSAPRTANIVSTLTSKRRKLPTTSTTPMITLTMPDESAAFPEILNVHNNLMNSNDTKTEDPQSRTFEAMILTNSVIATTPLISKIIPTTNDPITADISTFLDDLTTMTIPAVVNASITTPSMVAKAPAVETDTTITTTSATINAEIETTLNYSVTDNPIIENTNTILTDPTTTITFAASTETEIASTNVNVIPEATQTIVTDPVIKSAIANTEAETTSMMTNYSIMTTPVTANERENADIDAISTIANYFTTTIPTTISTHDVTDSAIPNTSMSDEVETSSMIRNYSTFTTTAIKNTTTIPITITDSSLATVISSTVDSQHVHATTPMTTSNLADANTVTTDIITTSMPPSVIIPTINDLNVITTSENANVPSTSVTSKIPPITIQSRTTSVSSSKAPITSTSTNSTDFTTLTTESSIYFTNPSNLDINSNSETLAVTTAESTQTTEIPTTFETPPTFTSTATAKPLPSTKVEASSVVTTALLTQEDESSSTSMVIQTPSTPFAITTLITNKATVALEKSTASTTLSATIGESIAPNSTIRTTTNAYEPDSVQTISEKFTTPDQKTSFKEVTSIETQTQDQTTTTINKPSFARTSNEYTTPEMEVVFKETILKATESQKQNQTTSKLNTTNYQFSQKTARRRVLNRTNNWLGSPTTLQRTNQYPRHQVTAYHERSRRPPTYISSSKIEKNRRRRIRVNSEAFNSTIRSDQDNVDVQNITENHTYNRMENIRRRKVVLKQRVEEEATTILPVEETTVFLQPSTVIENETLQTHHENENIEEKQKIIFKKIKQSQESFTKETNINSSSINESPPDSQNSQNSQTNIHVVENLPELKNSRKIMKILKNVRPKSEEKNAIEEANADFDSINTNLQANFSKSPYVDKNLSDKRITGRRMRVALKNVRPKSEDKNSTIEEINVDPNSDKNLENNLLNNNISQNISNEEKTRRRMRVVLKRVKSKSEEEDIKTEKASTEYDSTNESLQGTFSNNFYSAKNLPVEYRARRRMRVILKSIKPKSEEKNSTAEEITVSPNSTNEDLQDTFSNNFRTDKNFPVDHGTKRRTRVVLKSIKPKSEERNSTIKETSVDPDSTNKNLQNTFSNNFRRGKNLPIEHETRRRMRVILKSVKPKSEERDSVAEETNIDSDYTRKDPQVLYTFHFSNNLHVGDNLPDKEKTKKNSKSEEEEAMTEQPEDTKSQTTGTSVSVEEDTDRPSLEVTNGGSISRNSGSGSNRQRKPTPFTTIAPLTNTLSNTLVHRRSRPVETTLSPRIDFIDTFEDTESYVKSAGVLHDQNTDVSDQSIHAQELAVTLSDPPTSSSNIGQTPLRDADRRKISTTVAPRTDPTTSRTVSRYDANFRSRQRPRTKDRPTVNTTTRPRRPPVIDYDYYEDEVPIVVGKSVLNSKLFLTSKGTVRCLDQGNFPHPYSCKKFITCARMVNGQVIGTEYTCPDKLSFDPIGGICNWSAGLGCKD